MCGTTAPSRARLRTTRGQFDKHLYHFKFDFLQRQVARLNCDYFVWLDADNYFVRHPRDALRVLDGDAIHACLERNMYALDNLRPDWWGCPLPALVKFFRVNGVRHDVIYNTTDSLALQTVLGIAAMVPDNENAHAITHNSI